MVGRTVCKGQAKEEGRGGSSWKTQRKSLEVGGDTAGYTIAVVGPAPKCGHEPAAQLFKACDQETQAAAPCCPVHPNAMQPQNRQALQDLISWLQRCQRHRDPHHKVGGAGDVVLLSILQAERAVGDGSALWQERHYVVGHHATALGDGDVHHARLWQRSARASGVLMLRSAVAEVALPQLLVAAEAVVAAPRLRRPGGAARVFAG